MSHTIVYTHLCLVDAVDGDPGEVSAHHEGPEGVSRGGVGVKVYEGGAPALHAFLPHVGKPAHVNRALDDHEHHAGVHDHRL